MEKKLKKNKNTFFAQMIMEPLMEPEKSKDLIKAIQLTSVQTRLSWILTPAPVFLCLVSSLRVLGLACFARF